MLNRGLDGTASSKLGGYWSCRSGVSGEFDIRNYESVPLMTICGYCDRDCGWRTLKCPFCGRALEKSRLPPEQGSVMSVGDWIVTYLWLCIPFLNVLLLIIWACGVGNRNRVNYCRAVLVLAMIAVVGWGLLRWFGGL